MTLRTAATDLFDIEAPVVLAPMDAIAGGELAAAVSRAGGLGMIGGGYGDDASWLSRQFDLADRARVGCGFITWSLDHRTQLLEVALEHAPVAVMLSFGDPGPYADTIRASGARLLCQVQTLAQAEHALEVGADVLVAQGSEAGGHGWGRRTTLALVPEIVDLTLRRGSRVPVLAAGGIADGRGLAAALMLGAAGVLLGTRFYAATEALSTRAARDRVAAATGDDTVRSTVYDLVRGRDWPAGHTMNTLGNAFTARWHGADTELLADLSAARASYAQAVANGDYNIANVTVGQAAGLVSSEQSAAEIVSSLVVHAEARLGRAGT